MTEQISTSGEGRNVELERGDYTELDVLLFPFLGTKESGYASFEYVLLGVGASSVEIALPKWAISRDILQDGEEIYLNICVSLNDTPYAVGRVVDSVWDDELESQRCTISLEQPIHFPYPVQVNRGSSQVYLELGQDQEPKDVIKRTLRDIILLKQGISIYLGHLIPYFSRVSEYPIEEYPMFKEEVWGDIQQQLQSNRQGLIEISQIIDESDGSLHEITRLFDLDRIRQHLESEVCFEIFEMSFDSEAPFAYLRSIKELEKKLYVNYNLLVAYYLQLSP